MSQLTLFDYSALDPETRIVVQQEDKEFDRHMGDAGTAFVRACHNLQKIHAALKSKRPGFQEWVASKGGLSHGTAYRMLDVARMYPNLGQIPSSSPSALYLLASPSTPEAARQEALTLATSGQEVTHAKARKIVEAHRPIMERPPVIEPEEYTGWDDADEPTPSKADIEDYRAGLRDVFGDDDAPPARMPLPMADAPPKTHITLNDWNEADQGQREAWLKATSGRSTFNSQSSGEEINESIEWALWSWNPVTGCLHGCPYCYARDIATTGPTAGAFPNGFQPTFIPSRLSAPANTRFPHAKAAEWMGHKNVFTCSMADLFGRWVPREWIDAVIDAVRAAPQWNFLLLTKFPQRMAEFTFPSNAWVGTSVDCQARVKNAEKAFRKIRAGVKWLSCEPLIEPLTFKDIGAFDWLVLGGASRSTQTPEWKPPREWVASIKKAAREAGVKVYEKANLYRRVREYPGVEEDEPMEAPAAIRYLATPE